jgi:hypothetical protein
MRRVFNDNMSFSMTSKRNMRYVTSSSEVFRSYANRTNHSLSRSRSGIASASSSLAFASSVGEDAFHTYTESHSKTGAHGASDGLTHVLRRRWGSRGSGWRVMRGR